MRPVVFIDCETTGLDPGTHELLEVAAIRVAPRSFREERELVMRVRPERIEAADPYALRVNGYREAVWVDALPLAEAMAQLAPLLEGAMLAGHNPAFDRAFLEAAWKRVGHRPADLDHHLLDTASLAWPLFASGELTSVSLTAVCVHFGILRGQPHHAFDDARASLDVARRLVPAFLAEVA